MAQARGNDIIPPLVAQLKPFELFKSLQVRDPTLRAAALDQLVDRLHRLTRENRGNLLVVLPTVLRLCVECPFVDVRARLGRFVASVRDDYGVPLPLIASSSAFIPTDRLVNRDAPSDGVRRLFEWSFVVYGRVSNLAHVLAYHPSYLECFLKRIDTLLYEEGPLPVTWRCFIAVIASARHNCVYLVRRQQDAFIAQGGDPEWLRGLTGNPALPPKLAALAELNALLAHRPWLVTPAHVRSLTQASVGTATAGSALGGATDTVAGAGSGPSSSSGLLHTGPGVNLLGQPVPQHHPHALGADGQAAHASGGGGSGWSLTELVHAICLMSTYHSLCSTVQALGICREPDNGLALGAAPVGIVLKPPKQQHQQQQQAQPPASGQSSAIEQPSPALSSVSAGHPLPLSPALSSSGSANSGLPYGSPVQSSAAGRSGMGRGGPQSSPVPGPFGLQYAPATQVAAIEQELKSRLLAGEDNIDELSEIGGMDQMSGSEEEEDGVAAHGRSGYDDRDDGDNEDEEEGDRSTATDGGIGGGWRLSRNEFGVDSEAGSYVASASRMGGVAGHHTVVSSGGGTSSGSGRGRTHRGARMIVRRRGSRRADDGDDVSGDGDGRQEEDDVDVFERAGAAPSFDFGEYDEHGALGPMPPIEYGIPPQPTDADATHASADSGWHGGVAASADSLLYASPTPTADFRHLLGSGIISNVSQPAFNTRYRERKRMHNERRNARRRRLQAGGAGGAASDDDDAAPAVAAARLRRNDSSAVVVGNTDAPLVGSSRADGAGSFDEEHDPQDASGAADAARALSSNGRAPSSPTGSDGGATPQTRRRMVAFSSSAAIVAAAAAVESMTLSPSASPASSARAGSPVGMAPQQQHPAALMTDFDHQQHLRAGGAADGFMAGPANTSTRARSLVNSAGCDPFAAAVGGADADAGIAGSRRTGSGTPSALGASEFDIGRFRYVDFDTAEGMFVTHDFGWEDHAYALLQRFYPASE